MLHISFFFHLSPLFPSPETCLLCDTSHTFTLNFFFSLFMSALGVLHRHDRQHDNPRLHRPLPHRGASLYARGEAALCSPDKRQQQLCQVEASAPAEVDAFNLHGGSGHFGRFFSFFIVALLTLDTTAVFINTCWSWWW